METIQQDIRCQLCSELYTDPRTLPCLHSYCRSCLDREARDTNHSSMVACHLCRWCGPLPVGGASNLPKNLHLAYQVRMAQTVQVACERCAFGDPATMFCFKCLLFLCKPCAEQHPSAHKPTAVDERCIRQLLSVTRSAEHCCPVTNHTHKAMDLYCEACNALICWECATTGEHKDHRNTGLADIAGVQRDCIRRSLEHAYSIASKLGETVDRIDGAIQMVETFKTHNIAKITEEFENLQGKLDARRQLLLTELDTATSRRASALEYRRKKIQRVLQDLYRHCEMMYHTLQGYSDQEVVAMEKVLPTALSETLRMSGDGAFELNHKQNYSVLLETDKLLRDLDTLGQVKDAFPYAPVCTWSSTSVATAKSPYHICICTMTETGETCGQGGAHVEVDLVSKRHSRLVTSGSVKDHGNGTYTVTLTPQCDGSHALNVLIDGRHVNNSPFDLEVQKQPKHDYTRLKPPEEVAYVKNPWCLAVHRNGDIFVGSKANSIHVFDRSGTSKHSIGSSGHEDGQFNGPRDLAVGDELLYVADCLNHRVQVLTTRGEFVLKFGEYGTANGQFNGPYGLAVDGRGRIYVCDSGNDRIQTFSDGGSWLMSIDGKGRATFDVPKGIALDPQGNIYVAALSSTCVMVFTPGGRFLSNYGNLKNPARIAVSNSGFSFVGENGSDSVVVFDPQSRRVHTVKGLSNPNGITMDPVVSSTFYVISKGANTILKYSL